MSNSQKFGLGWLALLSVMLLIDCFIGHHTHEALIVFVACNGIACVSGLIQYIVEGPSEEVIIR